MPIGYSYVVMLFLYGMAEIFVQIKLKGRPRKRVFDITYHFVTIPFGLLLIFPTLLNLDGQYVPRGYQVILLCLFFALGLTIRMKGYFDLSTTFSDRVELKEDHVLIRRGIYRHIRHPLYLASILMCFGCVSYLFDLLTLFLMASTLFGIMFRISKEESYLSANLRGYKEYCKTTKRFIPRIM